MLEWQQHVRRHARPRAGGRVLSHAQADFERLDVALGPADVALRGEAGIDAAIEHRALTLLARGQPHGQRVADPDAIDVGFLDVGAHPQVVRIDQRHHRLAGVTTSPARAARRRRCRRWARGARAYSRRTSAFALRAVAAGCCCAIGLHLAATHRHLLGVRRARAPRRRAARRSACASASTRACAHGVGCLCRDRAARRWRRHS